MFANIRLYRSQPMEYELGHENPMMTRFPHKLRVLQSKGMLLSCNVLAWFWQAWQFWKTEKKKKTNFSRTENLRSNMCMDVDYGGKIFMGKKPSYCTRVIKTCQSPEKVMQEWRCRIHTGSEPHLIYKFQHTQSY